MGAGSGPRGSITVTDPGHRGAGVPARLAAPQVPSEWSFQECCWVPAPATFVVFYIC